MSSVPRIGVSLALEYLAGARDAPELGWYGPVDAMLGDLAEAGVTSIELREIRPDSEIDTVRGALDRLCDTGMAATIHGVLPPHESGDDWHRYVPALVAGLERLRDREAAPTVVTVHAYTAVDGTPHPLGRRSAARLAQMARWSELEGMQAIYAVELNRAKASVDPSITYDGVLDVVWQAGHVRVGSCFDFGHAWSNVLGGLLPAAPPVAYLEAVVHTHIHDIGPTGRTHWPLTESRLPVQRFVSWLSGAGYSGVWNLELSPERFAAEGRPRERTIESVTRLRTTLHAQAGRSTGSVSPR